MRYRLAYFLDPGECYHLARAEYRAARTCECHDHDFAELFYIEAGHGVHLINDLTVPLQVGDMVLIRPRDYHGFRATRGRRFTMVNLAFHRNLLTHIRRRYFDGSPHWPGAGDALPAAWRLDDAGLSRIAEWASSLSMSQQRRIDLESFLLNVFRLVTRTGSNSHDDQPDWLRDAITSFTHQADLSGGPSSLATLAGRSPEHVNRTVRRFTGRTTTELINDIRLNRAAHLLRMTDQPIIDIAMDAGFDNLGYFYRRFRNRFATTPRRFRAAAQAPVR